MVSFNLATSQLDQTSCDSNQHTSTKSTANSVANSEPVSLLKLAVSRSPNSSKMTTSNTSAFPFSSSLGNTSIFDSLNDLHECIDNREVSDSDAKGKLQTYKDKRKSYRLEKKKMAEELISAIQDPTIMVMSDWLKVRTTLKQWNKYFCELRPGSLYLYKSQKTHKSSNWIGTVMLKMCELIQRPSKKNGFCFKLFHALDHPIWAPKGPHSEAFTSIMFPLPMSYVIFRAPSEDAGRKWMEAIELSLKCSSLMIHKHLATRDSVPTTPLSNGSGTNVQSVANSSLFHRLQSIDRSDDDLATQHLTHESLALNDSEIEKHFDLCDDGHTDQGEQEDSQEHHTSDSDDESFFGDDDFDQTHTRSRHSGKYSSQRKNSKTGLDTEVVETNYVFDGGNEEFGLVGDAGQTEDVPEENKSLLWTLLKQVRPGMDLSKVVLPTFILEPRSFLEKLTDYYFHCDILSKAVLEEDPLLRMKLVLKWYLSGFYKKPKGLKKPYNPILGETFRCFWQHQETESRTYYIAEQVSHHPPVSAFYVTNRKDGFCISGSILAKSKFYGNSISAILDGTAKLTLLSRGEDYLITFPYAHCKGIFFGPLAFELGGKVTITCAKTGYKTELDFKLKPFFGSDDQCNLVEGKLRLGKETLGTIEGHWDSEIRYHDKRKDESELFWSGIDPKVKASRLSRYTVPLEEQADTESEKLWHKVTLAIRKQDQEAATEEKTALEEAQREAVKQRNSRLELWNPRLFTYDQTCNDWTYKMAEVRPWDNRTDIKQYEYKYVIRTLTRHLHQKNLYSVQTIEGQPKQIPLVTAGGGESTRSKIRMRRQITCADPANARLEASGQRAHNVEDIALQLTSVERDLALLKEEVNRLQSIVSKQNSNHLSSQVSHQKSSPVHRLVPNTATAKSFNITNSRATAVLNLIPVEVRQVLLVPLVYFLLHFVYSTFFLSTPSTSTSSVPVSPSTTTSTSQPM